MKRIGFCVVAEASGTHSLLQCKSDGKFCVSEVRPKLLVLWVVC